METVPPLGEYFTALLIRFCTTCLSFAWSALMKRTFGSTSIDIVCRLEIRTIEIASWMRRSTFTTLNS